MTKNSGRSGFTLIELIVVIAIIVLLSSIMFVNFGSARAKARDAQRISDLSQLQLAFSLYFDRCSQYPSSLSASANNGCPTTPTAVSLGTYIAQIPVPPAGAGQSVYDYAVLNNASGQPVNYVLHTKLEYYNAAVAKSLNASSIPQTGGTWSPSTTAAPYTSCSNGSASVDYCVGP